MEAARLAGSPLPEPTRANGILTYRETFFASPIGFRPLAVDIHLPVDVGPCPVLVYIHGGAFQMGHRTLLPRSLSAVDPFVALPQAGIAVATVNYRLCGEAIYPACVQDVAAAIAWLRDRSRELGIDPDRIATWGESAGGYLAVKAGLGAFDVDPVQAVVAWCAPVDFLTMGEQGVPSTDDPDSPESLLMGAPIQTIPEAVAAASLLSSVSPTSPPALVMHGDADREIPHQQASQLAERYEEAGAQATLIIVEDGGHSLEGVDPATVFRPVQDFLREHLVGVPEVG